MRWGLCSFALLLGLSSPARAQGLDDEAQSPWGSVAAENRTAALELFARANETFIHGDHKGALTLYQQALEKWDHPTIHYNVAQALLQLDRPVEAYAHVKRAVTWRGDARDEAAERARALLAELEKQLVRLAIICEEPGAKVTLDGMPLFQAPGRVEQVVLPGDHEVVVQRVGRLTTTRSLRLKAGPPVELEVQTLAIPEKRLERRWTAWKPWVVVGAGAAVAGAGVLLELKASSDMRKHDDEIDELCRSGCAPEDIPDSVRDLHSRAELENVFGLTLIGVGAAAVVTGAVLVYLNSPRMVEQPARAFITPLVDRERVGVLASVRF